MHEHTFDKVILKEVQNLKELEHFLRHSNKLRKDN